MPGAFAAFLVPVMRSAVVLVLPVKMVIPVLCRAEDEKLVMAHYVTNILPQGREDDRAAGQSSSRR